MSTKKTSLLSCRVNPIVKNALEEAAQRDRRSLSNFMEGGLIRALPADLQAVVRTQLGHKATKPTPTPST